MTVQAPPLREPITDRTVSNVWSSWLTNLRRNVRKCLVGDGTMDSVLKKMSVRIYDGTNANTIKFRISGGWNVDAIEYIDNISKGDSKTNYDLSLDGVSFSIKPPLLGGNCLVAMAGGLRVNATLVGGQINAWEAVNDGDNLKVKVKIDEVGQDWTAVVDTGGIVMDVLFVTDS